MKIKYVVETVRRRSLKVIESAPVFQTKASLEELAKRPKTVTPKILQKVQDMKDLEPQVLSGCWVDRKGTLLAVYFGRGDIKKSSKGGKSKINLRDGEGNLGDEANVMVRYICHLLSWTYQYIPQGEPGQSQTGVEQEQEEESLPPLRSPRPLSEQYHGRTLQDLEGDLSSRQHHGIWVSTYIFPTV